MLRILIADQHSIVLEGLRIHLEAQRDWQVVAEATSGEQTVANAIERRPDVVLLAYDLASMNGIEATHQIRTKLPDTEVLVYTMYNNEDSLRAFLQAGARGCVLKSERMASVVEGVRTVAAHKPYFAPPGIQEAICKVPHALNAPLTNRERAIVRLIATGQTNKRIARSLGISIKTFETHRAAVMRKLTLSSSAGLVRYAVRNGLAIV